MTQAAAVRDALAAKVAAVAGMTVVHANGTTGTAGVKPMPRDIVDTPCAIIRRGPTERSAGMVRTTYKRRFEADFYFALGAEPALADQWVDQVEDALFAEFANGISLGGLVMQCLITGTQSPTDTKVGEKSFLLWTVNFESVERFAVAMTV